MTWFKRSFTSLILSSTVYTVCSHTLSHLIFPTPSWRKKKGQIQSFPVWQNDRTKLRMVKEFAFSCKASIRAEIWTQVLVQHYSVNYTSLSKWKLPVLHSRRPALSDWEYLDQGRLGKETKTRIHSLALIQKHSKCWVSSKSALEKQIHREQSEKMPKSFRLTLRRTLAFMETLAEGVFRTESDFRKVPLTRAPCKQSKILRSCCWAHYQFNFIKDLKAAAIKDTKPTEYNIFLPTWYACFLEFLLSSQDALS